MKFWSIIAASLCLAGCGSKVEIRSEVKTYAAIGVKDGPLTLLGLDPVNMAFTSRQSFDVSEVNYLRASKTNRIFALKDNQIVVLNIPDISEAVMSPHTSAQTVGDPTAIEVSKDERFVFTAHWSDNILSARTFDGQALSEPLNFDCGWAHQFRPHINGKWAYAACMKNEIQQFSIDHENGLVEYMERPKLNIKGGPRHLDFHPDGKTLYALLQITSQIAVFDIDEETGQLAVPPRQIINTTADGSKNKSSDINITPDGRWVYAFNRKDQSMALLRVLPNKSLEFIKVFPMNFGEVRDWSMAPDGSFMITASNQGHVGIWAINNANGDLTLQDQSTGHGDAISVALISSHSKE